MGRTFLGVSGSDWYHVITRLPLEPEAQNTHTHIVKWDTIKPDDQAKILKHFSDTGNGWLDAETFNKHKIEIPENYAFLLGDVSGPKAKST